MEESKKTEENEKMDEQTQTSENEVSDQTVDNQETAQTESIEGENSSAELEVLRKEKEELLERLLRVQAEYDNFRKRTQKEKEADRKYKSQSVVTELLPVLDNFERALDMKPEEEAESGVFEGLEMVYRQMKEVLEKEGVEEIKTTGEPFDPHVHQAVMQVEDENYESNVVIEELQKGYRLKDRVIRPAMVKVNQ